MAAPTIEQIATLAATLGVGGIAAKVIDWLAKRHSEARKEPADLTRAAADFQEALTGGGKELIEEFRREFRYLRGRVVDLQSEVDKGKAETAESRMDAAAARALAEAAQADHARCQAELKELKDKIDELMAGPVATYGGATGK